MNNLPDLIDNPITGGYKKEEIQDFINDINTDISLRLQYLKNHISKGNGATAGATEGLEWQTNRKMPERSDSIKNYFSKTQKWLGHITDIKNKSFTARLQDLTSPGTEEMSEFDTDEISREDQELIQIGSAFYWSVGYSHENGQVSKKSLIRFQRVTKWDEAYADNALDRAKRLSGSLRWEE